MYLFRLCVYICLYMHLKFTKVDHCLLLKICFSFGFQATDFLLPYCLVISPNGSVVKNPPAMQEIQVLSLDQGRFSSRRKWQPTPVLLLGKSHGERTLASYSPWGHRRVRHDLLTKWQPCLLLLSSELALLHLPNIPIFSFLYPCSFWLGDLIQSHGFVCNLYDGGSLSPMLMILKSASPVLASQRLTHPVAYIPFPLWYLANMLN